MKRLNPKLIEDHGTFETTAEYRDCECEKDYIKPASIETCSDCGAIMKEQPDSRVNEIVMFGIALGS